MEQRHLESNQGPASQQQKRSLSDSAQKQSEQDAARRGSPRPADLFGSVNPVRGGDTPPNGGTHRTRNEITPSRPATAGENQFEPLDQPELANSNSLSDDDLGSELPMMERRSHLPHCLPLRS